MKYKIPIRFYPSHAQAFEKDFEFEFSRSTVNRIKNDLDYLPRQIKNMLKEDYKDYFEHNFGMDFLVKNEEIKKG